jgi:hypothetical protein
MSTDGITVTTTANETPVTQGFNHDSIKPIAGFLGLDTSNLTDTDTKYVRSIYEFLRGDEEEMTELELLSKLRTLENRLGMTSLGERRLDKIYRYVTIQSQIEDLEKARDRELR